MSRLRGSLASLFSKLLEISKDRFSVFIEEKKNLHKVDSVPTRVVKGKM